MEERLAALEKNLKILHSELDHSTSVMRESLRSVRQDLDNANRETFETVGQLTRTVEEVAVGGLNLELAGVIWLIVGVVFATIPQELAACLESILN